MQGYRVEVKYGKTGKIKVARVTDKDGHTVSRARWEEALGAHASAEVPLQGVCGAIRYLVSVYTAICDDQAGLFIPLAITPEHVVEVAAYNNRDIAPADMLVSLIIESVKEWLYTGAFPGSLCSWRYHNAAQSGGNGRPS